MNNRKNRRRLSDANEFEEKTEEIIEKETEAAWILWGKEKESVLAHIRGMCRCVAFFAVNPMNFFISEGDGYLWEQNAYSTLGTETFNREYV